MIDHWRQFSDDWDSPAPSPTDGLHQASSQRDRNQYQTMMAVLTAQQKVGDAVKAQGDGYSCHQFMADIRTSSWHDDATQVKVIDNGAGFNYEYLAHSRVCFKGSLNTLRSLPSPSVISTARYELDLEIVFKKLTQLKDMFPNWTHLWVILNAFVTAHYLHHACPIDDTELRRVEPLIKNYKVQFDQVALHTSFYPFISKLAYTVHKVAVGQYASHTLSVTADDLLLMNIALGMYQSVKFTLPNRTNEVDVLIG
ncbi:MAG: hypothetical protein WAQ08_17005 [Aquabacterium sp.]|uniref:hypothetical protein n=1 Tax=Aquabacterium sp. TaxID=1872578 RepID=UPI003BAEEC24